MATLSPVPFFFFNPLFLFALPLLPGSRKREYSDKVTEKRIKLFAVFVPLKMRSSKAPPVFKSERRDHGGVE